MSESAPAPLALTLTSPPADTVSLRRCARLLGFALALAQAERELSLSHRRCWSCHRRDGISGGERSGGCGKRLQPRSLVWLRLATSGPVSDGGQHWTLRRASAGLPELGFFA